MRKVQLIYKGNDKSPDTAKLTSKQKRTTIGQNLAKLNYNIEKNQEVLSSLERCLSRLLPGRMLMMGIVIKCAAAYFSSRNIFYNPLDKREEAKNMCKSCTPTLMR